MSACGNCNNTKSDKTEAFDSVTKTIVPLFNPHRQNWHKHFKWSKNGTKIIGKTTIGQAAVTALSLNRERFVKVRTNRVSAGWHPPKD